MGRYRREAVGIVIAMILVAAFGFTWMLGLSSPQKVPVAKAAIAPIALATSTVELPEGEPVPIIPKGFKSWNEVLNYLERSKPESATVLLRCFKDVNGTTPADIVRLAAAEQNGRSFAATLPAGTPSVNTGLGATGYTTYAGYRQKTDRAVLTGFDGKPKVYQSCGNPMRLVPSTPAKKKVLRPCPPVTDVGKPSNPTYEAPAKNIAPPTKGYTPGNAEEVVKQQEEDKGKDGPTEHGSVGEGTGGTTNPDGSVIPAPPPSTEPGPTYPGENDHEEPITN